MNSHELDWTFDKDKDPSFRYEDGPHLYHFQKGILISCTGIIRSVGWEPKEDIDRYTPQSAEDGTRRHQIAQDSDEGKPSLEVRDEDLGYLAGWQRFVREYGVTMRLIERPMYHRTLLYGVTPDREVLIGGKYPAMVEIKSGAMKWWTKYQLCLQDLAIQSWQAKPQIRRRIGVKLLSEGDYIVKEWEDIGDYARAKAAVVTAHANENETRAAAEPSPVPGQDPAHV